jgi:hypothetical protein
MWQKCPICNGTGVIPGPLSNSLFITCVTCNGKRIISELTGLPPSFEKEEKKKPYEQGLIMLTNSSETCTTGLQLENKPTIGGKTGLFVK